MVDDCHSIKGSRPEAVRCLSGRFINDGRFIKAEDQASGCNGRFISKKRPSGQISTLRLRIADFILSCASSSSAARLSHFIQAGGSPMAVLSRPASPSGRVIKASGRSIKTGQPRLPFYQQWPIYQGRPTPDGRFIKANGRFIKAL